MIKHFLWGYTWDIMEISWDIMGIYYGIYIYSVYGILYKNQLDMFLGVQLKIGGTHKMCVFFVGNMKSNHRISSLWVTVLDYSQSSRQYP